MELSQAVVLPPLQSSLRSRPEKPDRTLPRLRALAYQPIESESGEIRLVNVLPRRYNDVIRMNLYTKKLGDKPRYDALSYNWGTTPSSNRALVNGYPMPVQESLDRGLRRFRFTDKTRLWIIQEFVLASSKKMILEDCATSSADFLSAIKRSLEAPTDLATSCVSDRKQMEQLFLHLRMLINMELSFRAGQVISLYESWLLSRYSIAIDPRDKIFRLLGIVKSYVAQPIVPDYSKSWSQVLSQATMVMISEAGLSPYMSSGFAFLRSNNSKKAIENLCGCWTRSNYPPKSARPIIWKFRDRP